MIRVYPRFNFEQSMPEGLEKFQGRVMRTVGGIFDTFCESEWFEDPLVQQMILAVDKTQWIKGRYFESPVLGAISPRELSGGVKSLIVAYKCSEIRKEPWLFFSSLWGDNCIEWLCKISFKQDFYLGFNHALGALLDGVPEFEACAQTMDSKDWSVANLHTWRDISRYHVCS